MVRLPSSLNSLSANLFTVLSTNSLNLSRLKLNTPHHMILMAIRLFADTHRLAIDKEFYFIGIVIIGPEVDSLTWMPVPMREEMEHRLAGPLTLVHIITILREACKVDNSKIT